MKKLLTIAFAMLLGATLSFAQGTGSTDKAATGGKPATSTTKTKSHSHSKKGGTKKKKSTGTTTPAATTPK